jgi:amino acid transporter
VGLYNPLLSLVSMMVMPVNVIYQHPSDMLAVMAESLGGSPFRIVLCVDAFIVLCGGVLTAIVGVSALMCRLAGDNILPQYLATKNSRGAPYVSILIFTGLSMSLFLAIFNPSDPTAINNFGGVFAIAFLSTLVAFALSTILLKLHRSRLARRMIARWWEIVLSLVAVTSGLIGTYLISLNDFLSVVYF